METIIHGNVNDRFERIRGSFTETMVPIIFPVPILQSDKENAKTETVDKKVWQQHQKKTPDRVRNKKKGDGINEHMAKTNKTVARFLTGHPFTLKKVVP